MQAWSFIALWVMAWTQRSWQAALFGVWGVLTRMLTAMISRQRARYALLLPLSLVLLTLIVAQPIWQHWQGKSLWRVCQIAA